MRMDKGKKNNRLPINHDQFHYGCKKPLDNYSLSEGANDYLINEVNYVIEKLLLDGKKIAKENNDKTVIRSYFGDRFK